MKILLSIILTLFMLAGTANAIDKPPAELSPGYIAFADLQEIYGEPKVEINLGGAILALVGTISRHEDPELAEVISNLQQIRVLVYNLNENADSALSTVDSITSTMKSKQWVPVVSVNEDEEKIRIFMHITDEIVDGMVVMVVDQKHAKGHNEAVFINIVGELNPAQLSRVIKSLDINVEVDA